MSFGSDVISQRMQVVKWSFRRDVILEIERWKGVVRERRYVTVSARRKGVIRERRVVTESAR